jgi:arsenite/tail-anchored protein-transporting ATPase
MKKLLFVMGKGGVGKTTLSSAVALALGRRGSRVLLASLDPAHNLGDVFGQKLGNQPIKLREKVDGMEVDLAAWVKIYLDRNRRDMQASYAYAATLNLDSYLNILKYSPGTEEYAVLWAIEHIHDKLGENYDVVIFDTPPTALTMRFLAMPTVSLLWVRELTRMRELLLKKRQTVHRLNPEAPIAQGASTPADDRVHGKLVSIRSRLEALHKIFARHSYLTVVVNPDELSLAESERIRSELAALGIYLNSVCFNKTLADGRYRERVDAQFKGFPVFSSNLVSDGLRSAADLGQLDVHEFAEHIQCCI